jgi:two-component system sensor histidine kinase VanS
MRNSIRAKLFWGISSLIIFFVLLSWVLNFNFLDKYYIHQKGAALNKEYHFIDGIYHDNLDNIQLQLEKLVHRTGSHIVILDKNFTVKYASFPKPPGIPRKSPPDNKRRLPPPDLMAVDWSKPAYRVDTRKGPAMNTNFLNFTAKMHNGDYLWLGTPLPEIQQSIAISNQFFLLTGILTIIAGGIMVLLYSRSFTQPIRELNMIAQNMVKLDFSRMYPVKTNDEIGELGISINFLSEQLGKSISELQRANQRLAEDNERQKKIDENRKEFISNVSHELKTPLALIQGYAEGLKLNVNENEEDKNFYCNVIMDEAAKMNKLVRDLLDLSEIDSGYLRLDKEVFDLAQLTEGLLGKYHLIFQEKGIRLEVQKDKGTLVYADMSRIEQVMANYLNNALDHIAGGKELKVAIRVQGRKVTASVFNSGNPIPEEALEKIWHSFYKVDKSRTRVNGGTGLGLSIVRAILEQHQGNFGAFNLADGVKFWFELEQWEAG